MKDIKDIVFIIQARTQSTRVPNKMLRPFANSSLFEIAIEKILSSTLIPKENFYLSVMDEELKEIARKHKVNYYSRTEESTQEPVMIQSVFEWYNQLPFKYYVIINACNPLLTVETIERFVTQFLATDKSGMFGVFEKRTFIFDRNGVMLHDFDGGIEYLSTLETKFVEPTYEAAHSLYAGTCRDIGDGIYMADWTVDSVFHAEFFVMNEIECFDVDWPWQFEVAEVLYNNRMLLKKD